MEFEGLVLFSNSRPQQPFVLDVGTCYKLDLLNTGMWSGAVLQRGHHHQVKDDLAELWVIVYLGAAHLWLLGRGVSTLSYICYMTLHWCMNKRERNSLRLPLYSYRVSSQ